VLLHRGCGWLGSCLASRSRRWRNILGTDAASIGSTEAGARAAGPEEIARLADVYEVGPSWLAGAGAEKIDLNNVRFDLASADYAELDAADVEVLRSALAAMRGAKGGRDQGEA
jgi:hypothetical protein